MRRARVASIAVLVCTFGLVISPAASASRAGVFAYVHKTGHARPRHDFSVTARCPSGFDAVGSGGSVASRRAAIAADHLADLDADGTPNDGVTAGGHNNSRDRVAVSSVAICLDTTATAGVHYGVLTPPSGVPTGTGVFTSEPCPGATDALLGGGEGFLGPSFVGQTLDYVMRTADLNSGQKYWAVEAENNSGSHQTVGVEAACVGSLERTVTRVDAQRTVRPGHTASLKASCPRTSHVTDGGFNLAAGVLLASLPIDGRDRDHAPDDGWKVRAKNTGANANTLTVFALCAG